MKLYFSEATHPYTKLLQLVTKYAKLEVEETVVKKEDAAGWFHFGSTVAYEWESEVLFEYRAIAKLLASSQEGLLGTTPF